MVAEKRSVNLYPFWNSETMSGLSSESNRAWIAWFRLMELRDEVEGQPHTGKRVYTQRTLEHALVLTLKRIIRMRLFLAALIASSRSLRSRHGQSSGNLETRRKQERFFQEPEWPTPREATLTITESGWTYIATTGSGKKRIFAMTVRPKPFPVTTKSASKTKSASNMSQRGIPTCPTCCL